MYLLAYLYLYLLVCVSNSETNERIDQLKGSLVLVVMSLLYVKFGYDNNPRVELAK